MRAGRTITRLLIGEGGVAATEFVFLTVPLLLITLGLIDFGWLTTRTAQMEKAVQFGARAAVVGDPVAGGLKNFSGIQNGVSSPGDPCMDGSGNIESFCTYNPDPVVCTSTGCNAYAPFDQAAFDRIYKAMRRAYGDLKREDVVIEYRTSGLGFVGRPGNSQSTYNLVPMVTVRIQNVSFDFFALGPMFGIGPITLPSASATLSGEDMDNTSAL